MSTLSETIPATPMPNRVPASTTKAETMNDDLKPCPFCGGNELSYGYVEPSGADTGGVVQCHTCNAAIFAGDEDDAIEAWNARATHLPASPEGREAGKGEAERLLPISRIEMVDWSSGFEAEADPIYRIEVNGYCADFFSELGAQNFRSAVFACLHPAPATLADETLRAKIAEALREKGAVYHEDEGRWYHDRHRCQWQTEQPAEYLGWLKGYDDAAAALSQPAPTPASAEPAASAPGEVEPIAWLAEKTGCHSQFTRVACIARDLVTEGYEVTPLVPGPSASVPMDKASDGRQAEEVERP